MPSRILVVLCLLLGSPGHAEPLVIRDAVIVSGLDPRPVAGRWIRIEGGKIAAVGRGPAPTEDARVLDAAGRFLIPGLIDGHVHLYHATGLRPEYTDDYRSLYDGYMAQQPRSFLYFGFTTVVELNADADANARFEAAPAHPTLIHCAQGVVLADGFMTLDMSAEDLQRSYPGYLIDTYASGGTPADPDPAHSPKAAVEHVVRRGGRCVKLYYEEALWWPGEKPEFALPGRRIVRDVVEVAHARGLPVLLHATTPAGHQFALDTGIDILAHGMWEWPGQPFDAPSPKPDYRRLAGDVAQSDVWLQPTLSTIRNTGSLFEPAWMDDPGWRHAVPADYLAYLRGPANVQRDRFLRRFQQSFPPGTTEEDMPGLQRAFRERYKRLIVEMVADGANLAFATDTAVGGFGWASPPGLAGFREIVELADAGVDLATLFEALTVNNARALRIDDEVGRIRVGQRADLLLLERNPLQSAAAYDSIRQVILRGKVIDRDELSAAAHPPADDSPRIRRQ